MPKNVDVVLAEITTKFKKYIDQSKMRIEIFGRTWGSDPKHLADARNHFKIFQQIAEQLKKEEKATINEKDKANKAIETLQNVFQLLDSLHKKLNSNSKYPSCVLKCRNLVEQALLERSKLSFKDQEDGWAEVVYLQEAQSVSSEYKKSKLYEEKSEVADLDSQEPEPNLFVSPTPVTVQTPQKADGLKRPVLHDKKTMEEKMKAITEFMYNEYGGRKIRRSPIEIMPKDHHEAFIQQAEKRLIKRKAEREAKNELPALVQSKSKFFSAKEKLREITDRMYEMNKYQA
jgi:hypothetical protein